MGQQETGGGDATERALRAAELREEREAVQGVPYQAPWKPPSMLGMCNAPNTLYIRA